MTKKILVVDDSTFFTTKLTDYFIDSEEYVVIAVNNPSKALAKIKETKPDLIFLDIIMPLMSGEDVFSQLRQDPDCAGIPVVFLTSIITKDEVSHNVMKGQPFLAKPTTKEELLNCIRANLK